MYEVEQRSVDDSVIGCALPASALRLCRSSAVLREVCCKCWRNFAARSCEIGWCSSRRAPLALGLDIGVHIARLLNPRPTNDS